MHFSSPTSRLYSCALAVAVAVLVGCDQKSVDNYVGQAKQAASDAGASIKKTVEDTSDSVKKAAKDAGTQIKKAAESTKEQVQQAAAKAREAVLPTGSMKLSLQGSHAFDACSATFSPLAGQKSVLTLRTAKDESTETFPSVFIIAAIDAASAAALTGKTADATVYAAIKDEGDVWTTAQTVKIQILAVEGNNIRGQFTGGQLLHLPSGASATPSGEFVGVLPSK